MTVEQSPSSSEQTPRPPPTRAQKITAWAFLGAFGLTLITVLLTGLWVKAPRSRGHDAPSPPAQVTGQSDSARQGETPAR